MILDDTDQEKLIKRVEYAIIEVGGKDDWQIIIEEAGLDHVNVYGNVYHEDAHKLSEVVSTFTGNKQL